MTGPRAGWTAALAAILLTTACPSASARLPSLRTGFTDGGAYQVRTGTERATALANTRRARGSIVRLSAGWGDIATRKPRRRSIARDPSWHGYDWRRADALVRDITDAGLHPLLGFLNAPRWAEGPGRPLVSEDAPAGTWRPSPVAYRDFAEAAGRRYSGRYPDPLRPGQYLPRVRYWQAWNEPNLSNYLTPQWHMRKGRFVPASPARYARLLTAFYRGLKAADRRHFVVSAGTAPYGDLGRGGYRIPPAFFTRKLLCVSGRTRPRPVRCSHSPVRFDALAHHPYPIGPPRRPAIYPDDVVIADIAKLSRPLRVALRAGKVRPRRPKQIWATEISWDSSPPDPNGVPLQRQARWLEGALYTLWRQGVDVVTWFQLRDGGKGQGFEFTLQSGIFFRGETVAEDRPKPAFRAFRFPFTAYRKRGVAQLWGLAPDPGVVVTIEARRDGGLWEPILRLRARADRLFFARRRIRKGTLLRARAGRETGLTWLVSQNVTE